ncbi:MAG: YidC/Oxa1 family membrane protein insertase [Bacteroidota bacterium]
MIMVVSQILMQKMSGQSQSPQQKQMALIMPIMFFFIFNNFPSGLNLYYTLFNILTIVQQRYFTPEPKLEKKKGKPKKSRLERMRELQQKRKTFK